MVDLSAPGDDGPIASNRVRAATALGLAGRRAEVLAIIATAERDAPESTYVRTVLAPCARAALALHEGRPVEAVAALEPARATEIGGLGALLPTFLRAEAYARQRAWPAAIGEYERLLQHRGTDPFAPMIPLGQLGLARARVATGDLAGGRAAYDALLAMWRTADDDFPPRLAALAEYDHLSGRLSGSSVDPSGAPRD
jgi:hypothetical protein